MDFSRFSPTPIVDSHIHFGHPAYMPGLMHILEPLRIERINIACAMLGDRASTVPAALYFKDHHPNRVYVFGGLDFSILTTDPQNAAQRIAAQVDTLVELGCDGIKMVEGKPQIRKQLSLPDFDSQVFAPYWEKLAISGVPLIFHVNDPEEFWDANRIPEWARQLGWFCGDGTYPNNEDQYRQVLRVMDRHPNLKVIFAHFFFLSAQLPRLARYLDRYPQMYVDLTPGIEMYHNFSADPQGARDFFIQYQDRIIYGTDIGAHAFLTLPQGGVDALESQSRVFVIRHFLETEGDMRLEDPTGFVFWDPDHPYQGIKLPQSVLEKIYFRNFDRLVGTRPRRLNPGAIVSECERLLDATKPQEVSQAHPFNDLGAIRMVYAYFKSLV